MENRGDLDPSPPAASPDHSGPLAEQRARMGEIEGYLSLGMTILLFSLVFFPIPLGQFGLAILLTILAMGLVFGISGVRFGRGRGKDASLVSLVVLSALMLAVIFLVRRL